MDVLAQLASNTGYSVRVNHKVLTTAAASNKQSDVELVIFGLDGSNNLVIDVSICCDHIGNSTITDTSTAKIQFNDYLQERARVKIRRCHADYDAVGTAFALAIVSVAGQIHPDFLCLLWVLADKQTRNYYALIGAEEEIGSEAFTWRRERTFSFNKNSVGKAVAYATATRLHLSGPCTAQLRQRAVKLTSPCPLLNASCTALHMHHAAQPFAPLSTWMVVPTASHHLLLLLMQVPLDRRMWLLMIPTLPAASQPLTGLLPLPGW